jgi:SAM-dependent MidA family methyltransferase
MALALYHPIVGYYCRDRDRVGQRSGTDFFTASSLGPVFGELVLAALLQDLRQRNQKPERFTFVEIGAESEKTILDGIPHPFETVRAITVGQSIDLSGPCVVFSNELFDAQPCARFVRAAEGWREIGVRLEAGTLVEDQRPLRNPSDDLPLHLPVGYHLDLPRKAAALTRTIAESPWFGVFCAFDYGKTWTELSEACPQGTVRAYRAHQQTNDLWCTPGEQDLTCHICWDWISAALAESGFKTASILSQEAFFVKHASSVLAKIMEAEAHGMTPRKAGLLQLLHPSALGQKFQVLTAWRKES